MILNLILIYILIFSYSFSEVVTDNLEEAIIQLETPDSLSYSEGFIDNSREEVYISLKDLEQKLEIPKDKKDLFAGVIIYNQELVNISRVNKEHGDLFELYEWDAFNGSLMIKPSWKIQSDYREARERLKKNNFQKEEIIEKESWKLLTSGILNVGVTQDTIKNSEISGYYNYSNNFLYGNLNLSGSLGENKVALNNVYWQRDLQHNRKIILGDFYFTKKFNIGISEQINGFSVGKKNSWSYSLSTSEKEVKGLAPNGSIVELYKNNILQNYTVTENGKYSFPVDLRNGRNEYKVKIHLSDGEIIEKNVSLYSSENILKKGDFDYTLEGGYLQKEEMHNINFKYGLLDNLSLTLGSFKVLDDYKKTYNFYSFGEVGAYSIPYLNLPILHEFNVAFNDKMESIYRFNLKTNKFNFDFNYLYENNKKLNRDILLSSVGELEKHKIQITTPFKGGNLSGGYQWYLDYNKEKKEEYYLSFGQNYGKFYYNLSTYYYEGENLDIDLGIYYNINKEYLDTISANFIYSDKDSINLNFGKTINDSNWSYNFSYFYNEDTKSRFGLLFEYIPGGNLKYQNRVIYGDGKTTIANSVETNIYFVENKFKTSYNKSFDKGSIVGIVYLDKNGNNIFDEEDTLLEGDIEVNGFGKVSTRNGKFEIIGIRSYSPAEVEVTLKNDVEAYEIESKKISYVQTKPGGRMSKNFAFIPKTTAVFNIDFHKEFYYEDILEIIKNIKVKIKNEKTHNVFEFKWIDNETYFKDLEIGEYGIEIESEYPFHIEGVTKDGEFTLISEETKVIDITILKKD